MGKCKKDVAPLLMHWSYVFLALTHRLAVFFYRLSTTTAGMQDRHSHFVLPWPMLCRKHHIMMLLSSENLHSILYTDCVKRSKQPVPNRSNLFHLNPVLLIQHHCMGSPSSCCEHFTPQATDDVIWDPPARPSEVR